MFDLSERFCAQCNTTVEDAGGFCLLGHSLSEAPSTGSLSELRAEVDRAFEEARVQVAATLGAAPPPPPPPGFVAPSPGVAPAPFVPQEVPTGGPDPIAEFAPAPRMDWGPERSRMRKRR